MFLFSGRGLFAGRRHAPYDLLAHLAPGLMLDIGASNGAFSRLMLSKSPQSRVLAFEPFPGNISLLRKALGSDDRVMIVDKAVSDDAKDVAFHVASTVATEGGLWEAGYSSLGYIVTGETPKAGATITVKTIGVDEAIENGHVRFMKVDVQGGEMAVLRSASRALSEQRIDILHIEFSGERDVLSHIQDRGYVIFDTQYSIIPRDGVLDFPNWCVSGPLQLSTGHRAVKAWPNAMPTTAGDYLDFIEAERRSNGNIFTVLVCVSPRALAAFLSAAFAVAWS